MHIEDVSLGLYIRDAYRDYGTYVLEERAVPDFRDGLKPVQRRILWSMYEAGFKPNSQWAKSAETVGYTIGQYHPHGDSAVYSALVAMVNSHYPLIDGHGNFGHDLDPPASQRYTEARLSPLSSSVFACIDVAAFVSNYSGKRQEPLVLPSRSPILLLNGSQGIGVGLAVNIPPHNYSEVLDALLASIKGKSIDVSDILSYIKGPDYGHGTLISSKSDIIAMYDQGKGSLRYRCNFDIEPDQLVITEFAPNFGLETILKKCTSFVESGLLEYVYDESSEQNGTRLVIGYSDPHAIKDQIIPLLETEIIYNWYVTKRSPDKVEVLFMPLKKFVEDWLNWRFEVEKKMLELELSKFERTLLLTKAKLIAVKNLKTLYTILSKNTDYSLLKDTLIDLLDLTSDQADIILSMNVKSLARSNEKDLKKEIDSIDADIQALKKKLTNVWAAVKENLLALKADAPSKRGTKIGKAKEIDVEDAVIYFGVHEDGIGQRMSDLLSVRKKKPWTWLVSGTSFTIIERTGMAYRLSISQIKDGDTGFKNIVGLVSDSKYIVLSSDGSSLIIDHPASKKYLTMKLSIKDTLVSALPIYEGGSVWAMNDSKCIVQKNLKVTRNGSKGFNLIPRMKTTRILSVPKDGEVVSQNGILDPSNVLNEKTILIVGESNLVFYDDPPKKEILDKPQTINLIKLNKVEAVFIL